MTVPSYDDINEALDEIDKRGPNAAETLSLAALAIKHPRIRAILERMLNGAAIAITPGSELFLKAALSGAYIAGLNTGLTIKSRTR